DLAERIRTLLAASGTLAAAGQRGIETAARFSIERIAGPGPGRWAKAAGSTLARRAVLQADASCAIGVEGDRGKPA
ncbi:MAG: hypothetical protein EBS42_14745, partial [Caulobacteraceae bacterium]|nr:hypothetical protein [Caulobacteraceae bacterium]